MSGAILLETWLSAGTTIDSLWSMFIVVNLGLFWFFFLVHRPLLIVERMIAIAAYAGFAYINGNALINAYTFIEAVRRDLVLKFSRDFVTAPETLSVLNKASYAAREDVIYLTHMGGFILVFTLFVLRNVMIRRYYRDFPDQLGRQSGVTD